MSKEPDFESMAVDIAYGQASEPETRMRVLENLREAFALGRKQGLEEAGGPVVTAALALAEDCDKASQVLQRCYLCNTVWCRGEEPYHSSNCNLARTDQDVRKALEGWGVEFDVRKGEVLSATWTHEDGKFRYQQLAS